MRRIGDKPPALLLRDLEPSRQLVKLLSQLRQLIVSIHGDPMGVLPGPHRADSPQEGPDRRERNVEKAPNRTSTARQTTTEISRRFRCSSSSNAPWSLSWSYRQTAPTTWFRFITGEAARLEKAPSWYSLEKASLPRRAETTSPMRHISPRAEAPRYRREPVPPRP